MKSRIILAAFTLVVFSACNSETENDSMDTPVIEQQASDVALSGAEPVATMQLDGTTPQENTLEQAVKTATPSPAATTQSKAGLNPEHGQPGHRCDIAVGAPLSSAPATPQNAPQPMNVTPMAAPTATAPAVPTLAEQPANGNVKLNPAHGEPHHRCDLQVGAPLI